MNPNYGRERFDTEAQKLNPIFEITNLAHNFRKNIEIAWSKNTVYPESDGGGRFDPAGQCLVTSRLFQDILKQELPDVITTLHLGKIKSNIEGAKAILIDRKSTRLNSSHRNTSRMPSSA